MKLSHIKFELDRSVATLTLNRPNVLNALNVEMHSEIAYVLQKLVSVDEVKALVITGTGRAFCTGQDLEERRIAKGELMPDLGESLRLRYNKVVAQIKEFDFPVICAVNGVAVGAGAGLALACDIVVAAQSASFIFPFNKLGLIPDGGTTWSLPRAIGLPRAQAAIHLSEKITARQAEQWGMIWASVEDHDLKSVVDGYIKKILQQPKLGMALTKKALCVSHENSLQEQLELEAIYQSQAGKNPDYKERVLSFLNRKNKV